MLRAAWILASKDMRLYFRDRMGLVTSLLVPIALVTVFGWIMAYAFSGGSGMPKVTIWLVDEDHSDRSGQLLQALRESNMLECQPEVGVKPIDRARLMQKMADGDAHHGLIIPNGYGASSDLSVEVEVVRDPGRQMEDRILQFALAQCLFTSGDSQTWKQSLGRWFKSEGLSEQQLKKFSTVFDLTHDVIRDGFRELEALTGDSGNTSPKSTVGSGNSSDEKSKPLSNKETENSADVLAVMEKMLPVKHIDVQPPTRPKRVTFQQAQSVSGVSVMMMLFSLTNAGALLLAEREKGTLRRLMAVSIRRESILLGKYFYVVMAGLLQMSVLMVYGELMFKVGLFRDPVTLCVLVVSWVATAGSFGMAIATWSTSTKQGDGLATIIILVMAALGGCWFPVQMMNLPAPLEIAAKSTMTYWSMEGFQGLLWNGLSWMDAKILKAVGIQWAWTMALIGLSIIGFRRNYIA